MLPLLQSQRTGAGFTHGFTTRAGGVSGPPYDSLNLGLFIGDDVEWLPGVAAGQTLALEEMALSGA